MDLRDALLTARDDEGKLKVTPRIYFDRYMQKDEVSFRYNKLVICPFHSDTDASLGTFRHKTLVDVELYHCFGCGATGDVVKMHIETAKRAGKHLSTLEAIKDLMELFEVELSNTSFDLSYATFVKDMSRRLAGIERGYYNIRDFQEDMDEITAMSVDPYTKAMAYNDLFTMWKRKMKVGANRDS